MLSVSTPNQELKFITHGYHTDKHGKKYIRVYANFDAIMCKVRIQKGKTIHIIAKKFSHFPWTFTDNFVSIVIPKRELVEKFQTSDNVYSWSLFENIDELLQTIWFD